jgi:bisphosphoglycerate-dependent phosphoglycerate mutase
MEQIEDSKRKNYVATDYGDAKVSEEYMSYNPKTPKFNKKGEKNS